MVARTPVAASREGDFCYLMVTHKRLVDQGDNPWFAGTQTFMKN